MRQAAVTQLIEPADNNWRSFIWATYCCETCAGGVLVRLNHYGVVEEIFPAPPDAHEDIPEPARRFLQQAMETLHAPGAAAVMAGSAVDAMLKHRKLTEGSLHSRIDKAVESHMITMAMGD